jgi:cytochrome c oxidase subunit 2
VKRLAWLVLPLLLAGCSGVQAALDPAGRQAADIREIWDLMMWICGVMYLLVMLFLAAALWRGRKRLAGPPLSDSNLSPADRPLQKALTGWTALVIAGLVVLTLGSFLVDRQLAQAASEKTLKVRVTANQWWWQVEYDHPVAGQRVSTANELRLPVGKAALIELNAGDVIHSFWVPNIAGKQDLIPGRTNRITVTPQKVGVFRGQCAEFCGLQHAWMAFDVTVMPEPEYQAWAQRQLAPAVQPVTPDRKLGQGVFLGAACANCHRITGTPAQGRTGPDLTHMASRRTLAAGALPYSRASLDRWLRDPQSVKPGNHMPLVPLTDRERTALVAYLDSLK